MNSTLTNPKNPSPNPNQTIKLTVTNHKLTLNYPKLIQLRVYYRLCPVDDFLQIFTKCKGLLGDYNAPNFCRRK